MRSLAFALLFACLTCKADNEQDALKSAAEAFYELPKVNERVRILERNITNKLPFDRDIVVFTGGIAATLIQGRIGTKHIKDLDIKVFGGKLRTYLEYNFINGSAESYLIWELAIN